MNVLFRPTAEQVRRLLELALKAGDRERVLLCLRALAGQPAALVDCADVVEAQREVLS